MKEDMDQLKISLKEMTETADLRLKEIDRFRRENTRLKEENEKLKIDNNEQWEARCKLAFELDKLNKMKENILKFLEN